MKTNNGNFFVGAGGELQFVGERPTNDREALEISIQKWEYIRDYNVRMTGGASTCGLCMLYRHDDCEECPVAEYTGKILCRGTPHNIWMDLLAKNQTAKLSDIADEEVKFLRQIYDDLNFGDKDG